MTNDIRVTPLIEASEAFPAFEEAALEAEREILFGMRLFEHDLPLYSEGALATGARTWAELLAARAADGVRVKLLLTDFEPIVGSGLHQAAWTALEGFNAAAERRGASDNLAVMAVLHPGELGWAARMLFWPMVRWRLQGIRNRIHNGDGVDLERAPGLWRLIRRRGRALRLELFPRMRLWPATYHQKMATFDGRVAIVGGIDLARRMYDTREHDRPAQDTWHDVSVKVEGVLAADARRHLVREWNANAPLFNARVTGMGAPIANLLRPVAPLPVDARQQPRPPGGRFLRTRSRRSKSPFALGPRPDVMEIEAALVAAIGGARKLIYLETQFLRSPVIGAALTKAGRSRRDAELIVVLPAAPEVVAFQGGNGVDALHGEWLQHRVIQQIKAAWGDRAGFFALARPQDGEAPDRPRAQLEGAPIVYVHAKVAIFDTQTAIVGSANLNGRSLRWDTEAAVEWTDGPAVAAFLARLWRGHFYDDPPDPTARPLQAWRRRAERNAQVPPHRRKGFLLPYDFKSAQASARRQWWAPTNML